MLGRKQGTPYPKKRPTGRLREFLFGYALLAPALTLLAVFEFFPIFYGLYISLCNWRLGCAEFVGAENYTRALRDPQV